MATAQVRLGHQVRVVVNLDPKASLKRRRQDWDSWEPLREGGIEVGAVDLAHPRGWWKLRAEARRVRADVLHAHRDEALWAAWWALWGLRRPTLVAQRGTEKPLEGRMRRVFASSRTRAIVAVAEAVRESLERAVPGLGRKTKVVYGSVDPERFAPRPPDVTLRGELGLPDDARLLVSLSAYRKAKGLGCLLKAMAEVMAARPAVYAIFLGRGVPERIGPIAQMFGIADRCRFVGHQTDVPRFVSIAEFTVVAAVEREGLSGVLRESLAMEVPVISTDCAGNREIVEDRRTGLLVPVNDAPALHSALVWALDHRQEMKTMAAEGRRWVLTHCDPRRQADQLIEVYDAAAGPGSPQSSTAPGA